MYAELVVQTRRNLPADLAFVLREQWGAGAEPGDVIRHTALKDHGGWLHLVRYAQITSSNVYLVFTPDQRTLKLHLEGGPHARDLRTLRALVDEETRRIRTLLSRQGNLEAGCRVRLYAEGMHLQTGRLLPAMERVGEVLRANVAANLYVPVSAFSLSLLLEYEVREALHNVGAALLALLLWVAGAIIFAKPGYQYTEEG